MLCGVCFNIGIIRWACGWKNKAGNENKPDFPLKLLNPDSITNKNKILDANVGIIIWIVNGYFMPENKK